jgi:hypothetical protein
MNRHSKTTILRRLRLSPRRLAMIAALVLGFATTTGFAASLTVGSAHLWAGTQTLTKGTCTLSGSSAATDTYVDSSNRNTSYGGQQTMLVNPSAAGTEQDTYIAFNLSSCNLPTTAGADSATLNLVVTGAPSQSRTLTVTPVLSSFSASSLTWNQAQSLSYGSATTNFTVGTSNGATVSIPVTVDVDALIKNPSAITGWRITDDGSYTRGGGRHGGGSGSATTTFSSTNAGSNRPQLVIAYAK